MDLASTKILVSALFFILRFTFGMLPLKVYKLLQRWEGQDDSRPRQFINARRHQQVTCLLALLQSFGGGVLFATCFLHMMPEVYHSVEVLKDYGGLKTEYPLSQMTVSLGFFLVYFVEEFSHWFISKVPPEGCTAKRSTPISNTAKVTPVKFIMDEKEAIKDKERAENEKNKEMDKDVEEIIIEEDVEEESEENQKQHRIRYHLIVLAISLHSFFEGLAIGLQHSTTNIWYLFTAVCIHSATILFYITLELILAKAGRKIIIMQVFTLSVTSPLGVIVGLLITQNANMNTKVKSTAVVLLEGLSAGTILYLTFFEVLNREKERRVYRLRRALCIMGGFLLMALLQCDKLFMD